MCARHGGRCKLHTCSVRDYCELDYGDRRIFLHDSLHGCVRATRLLLSAAHGFFSVHGSGGSRTVIAVSCFTIVAGFDAGYSSMSSWKRAGGFEKIAWLLRNIDIGHILPLAWWPLCVAHVFWMRLL